MDIYTSSSAWVNKQDISSYFFPKSDLTFDRSAEKMFSLADSLVLLLALVDERLISFCD